MADASVPYRLYRVSDFDEKSGTLRISAPLTNYAEILLQTLSHLPSGVSPDSFSIDPNTLPFGQPVTIRLDDEVSGY